MINDEFEFQSSREVYFLKERLRKRMFSWVVKRFLYSRLSFVLLTDVFRNLSWHWVDMCDSFQFRWNKKKYFIWAFKWFLLWLSWCPFANYLIGQWNGFHDESSILDWTLFVGNWHCVCAMRIFYFQLTLFTIEFVQSKFHCLSIVKGGDPCYGEEFDWEVEQEFRVLCTCCVVWYRKERLAQGTLGCFP